MPPELQYNSYFYESAAVKLAGTASMLNNVLKIPVVIAAEMVQMYHRSELPYWVQDQLPETVDFVPIYKNYDELVKSADSVDRVPSIINHTHFVSSDDDPEIVGWLKQLRGDPKKRTVKGYLYLAVDKIGNELELRIRNGDVIDVSIGGSCNFSPGGTFQGQAYLLSQTNITLNHLAILPDEPGRCPSNVCGLNKDSGAKVTEIGLTSEFQMNAIAGSLGRFFQGPDLTQPVLDIAPKLPPIRPIYAGDPTLDQYRSSSVLPGDMNSMTEAELLKQIALLTDQLNAANKKSAELSQNLNLKDLTALQSEITDAKVQIDTLKAVNEKQKAEIDMLSKANAELIDSQKKQEEVEKAGIIDRIVAAKIQDKATLDGKCIKELRIMDSTLRSAGLYAKIKDVAHSGFPKPDPQDRKKDPGDESGTLEDAAISPADYAAIRKNKELKP